MQAPFLHTFDPFALQFSESFGIRWYGLAYLAAFMLGYLIIRYLAKSGRTPLPPNLAGDLVFETALGTVIGGRLGYCILYDPALLIKFSSDFPFWGLLEIHKGGMASHGGIIGLAIACLLFARRHHLPAFALCDLTVAPGALGIFFGRLANFVNGELLGRPVADSFPLAVKFPQEIFGWPFTEPDRLTSLGPVVSQLGVSASDWASLSSAHPRGVFVESVLQRIVDSVQQGNTAVQTLLAPVLTSRHPSQLYEAALEGLLVLLATLPLWRLRLPYGAISSAFVLMYPIARIVSEQFRLPDAHIGYQLLGLTRGQWLSVGMFFAGLIILAVVIRRNERLPQPGA